MDRFSEVWLYFCDWETQIVSETYLCVWRRELCILIHQSHTYKSKADL